MSYQYRKSHYGDKTVVRSPYLHNRISYPGKMPSLYWIKPNVQLGAGESLVAHYSDVIMGTMASQITSLPIVYLTVYSDPDQRKHQSSASLAFVWGIHRWPVNSPHKWPVTRKMFPFDDVIMTCPHFAVLDMPSPIVSSQTVPMLLLDLQLQYKMRRIWCQVALATNRQY